MLKTIPAPLRCRAVLFDATDLVPDHGGLDRVIVPAIIHAVVGHDLVLLWAVDNRGQTLTAVGGGLPSANFGELSPGVPALGCWCYQAHSDAQITIEPAPTLDIDRLVEPGSTAYVPSQMPPRRRAQTETDEGEPTFVP